MTLATRSRTAAWLLLAPFLVVLGVFVIWPLGTSVVLSTQQTFGPDTTRYVGADNFKHLLRDPLFWRALRNTGAYTLGTVLVQLPLAMLLAIALNHPRLRGRAVLRMIIFSPVLVGVVFVAMIFTVLFDKRTGLINQGLHAAVGWNLDFPWLDSYVITSLIIATLWQYVGYNMVYFLAALQSVPSELREAAFMDGAGAWARFRHVVLPAIRPVATFVVLLSVLGSFQLFELPYILLNGTSGPDNRGLTLVMYLYQTGFETGDLGYASAIGWVIAFVVGGFAVLQHFFDRSAVFR